MMLVSLCAETIRPVSEGGKTWQLLTFVLGLRHRSLVGSRERRPSKPSLVSGEIYWALHVWRSGTFFCTPYSLWDLTSCCGMEWLTQSHTKFLRFASNVLCRRTKSPASCLYVRCVFLTWNLRFRHNLHREQCPCRCLLERARNKDSLS